MPSHESFVAFVDALSLATNGFRTFIRQQFKEHGVNLTAEMMQVLRYLWEHDGVNQQEIANALSKDKGSLTSMLDNLVQRELVERQTDPQDRRNKRVVLTAKGRALQQAVTPLIEAMYEAAGTGLSSQQLRDSTLQLLQIAQNLGHPAE
jgi:DNA-binding MarR family transcriptional regulator